jgi:filamentous hemagglutinin
MQSREVRFADIAARLESLGGGRPRMILTPKLARQFIFPNGMILRFDLVSGQYSRRQGPHLNLHLPSGRNRHIYLR